MSFNERQLKTLVKTLQTQLNELYQQMTDIPCLFIDGLHAMSDEPDTHWKTQVSSLLTLNHIYPSWVLNMLNPSNSSHPNTVTIQFINTIVRDRAYTVLSKYVMENEHDAIISKD
jgi:hypothetical protein